VVVEFHDPVTLEQFGSRKALSDHCYEVVSRGVAAALAGRPQALLPLTPAAAAPAPAICGSGHGGAASQ
jgi:1-acyl-sn-glycerol-3-phosphate acyltransferase